MFDWYGNEGLEFPPRMGDSKVITIISGKRVEEPGNEFNLKKKGNVDSGFHLQLELNTGKKFIVNTWALFFAFRETAVKKGDTIEINHPEKGKYIVKKVKPEPSEPEGWE